MTTKKAASKKETRVPTHAVKVKHENGSSANYEQIGVAWENENGGLFVKFYGTQVIAKPVSIFPINREGADAKE